MQIYMNASLAALDEVEAHRASNTMDGNDADFFMPTHQHGLMGKVIAKGQPYYRQVSGDGMVFMVARRPMVVGSVTTIRLGDWHVGQYTLAARREFERLAPSIQQPAAAQHPAAAAKKRKKKAEIRQRQRNSPNLVRQVSFDPNTPRVFEMASAVERETMRLQLPRNHWDDAEDDAAE